MGIKKPRTEYSNFPCIVRIIPVRRATHYICANGAKCRARTHCISPAWERNKHARRFITTCPACGQPLNTRKGFNY